MNMNKNIIIYSKAGCAQCRATKRWLDTAGVEYNEVRVDLDTDELQKVKAMGFTSLPVIVADGIEPFFGFRPDILEGL